MAPAFLCTGRCEPGKGTAVDQERLMRALRCRGKLPAAADVLVSLLALLPLALPCCQCAGEGAARKQHRQRGNVGHRRPRGLAT